ncbi:carbonic anhydrase [Candidatus Chlorohelix sp.]|uniref:beta-class carbonic anhydrase n=1 Tax=Candidatus Chlorohelix sp. TaxID=3139201 RepID=UPI003022A550
MKDYMMGAIDEVLKANLRYVQNFSGQDLSLEPAQHLAVVACMDYRINIEHVLGLKNGDANIIRNAGGLVTDDALRSLLVSTHMLGVEEIMIINHTECGMLKFKDKDLLSRLQRNSGTATVSPAAFYAFTNLEENVLNQVQRVKSHPWIPSEIIVRGFIYDVKSGLLTEVHG